MDYEGNIKCQQLEKNNYVWADTCSNRKFLLLWVIAIPQMCRISGEILLLSKKKTVEDILYF